MRIPFPTATVIAVLIAIQIAAVPGVAVARLWRVPTDMPTIGGALAAATAGDVVEVACGLYHECGLELGQGVTLRSATGDPACVVIDGGGLDSVVLCDFADQEAVLEGVTLQHGRAQGLYPSGGGLLCHASRLVVRRCHFVDNAAGWGGGLHAWNAWLTVVDCAFTGNEASVGGAAIDCTGGEPVFRSCTVVDNHGIARAPAIRVAHAAAEFSGCTVVANELAGGASVIAVGDSRLGLTDCTVSGAAGGGDGVFLEAVRATISSVAVTGVGGAGLRAAYGSVVELDHATFAANGGGVVIGDNSRAALTACLVAFNAGVGLTVNGGDVAVSCSDVFGNAGGDYGGDLPDQTGVAGNIAADPLFCDLGGGDFGLRAGSPALPDGNACGVRMGVELAGCGTTAAPVVATRAEGLQAARPNPFNPRTTLVLALPAPCAARLEIVALDGARVATLLDDDLPAGRHEVVWDGRDGLGRSAPAGIYVARLTAAGVVSARRLALVR